MSRRFKNRHEKVEADPHARAPKTTEHRPPALDDSNSFVPFEQPDMRIANELNARAYVIAGSAKIEDDAEADAEADAEDDAEADAEDDAEADAEADAEDDDSRD